MTTFLKILCVGAGGGFGASFRHLLYQFLTDIVDLPAFGAIMIVNTLGCFLIGLAFVLIEGAYRRDGTSRLRDLPVSKTLADRDWWPDGDPTLPAVDLFRLGQTAEMLAGFFITGMLGAMTTFSLFSLLSLQLLQSGDNADAAFNAIGSVALGFGAVGLGLRLGRHWVPMDREL